MVTVVSCFNCCNQKNCPKDAVAQENVQYSDVSQVCLKVGIDSFFSGFIDILIYSITAFQCLMLCPANQFRKAFFVSATKLGNKGKSFLFCIVFTLPDSSDNKNFRVFYSVCFWNVQ